MHSFWSLLFVNTETLWKVDSNTGVLPGGILTLSSASFAMQYKKFFRTMKFSCQNIQLNAIQKNMQSKLLYKWKNCFKVLIHWFLLKVQIHEKESLKP